MTGALALQEATVPAARIPMKKIIEVLRLRYEARLSHARIVQVCGPSKGVAPHARGCQYTICNDKRLPPAGTKVSESRWS